MQLWPYHETMEVAGQGFNTFTGRVGHSRVVAVSPVNGGHAQAGDRMMSETELMDMTPDNMSGSMDKARMPGSRSTLREYEALEITSYNKLLDTLSVSGSVSISGYGQGASISGSYLNKESFEKASFTYLIRINVKHQPTDMNTYKFMPADKLSDAEAAKAYGDTYIKSNVPFPRSGPRRSWPVAALPPLMTC
ncbi:hypothetical protein CDD83_9439 [Cordyceps sp. RAO-2017]|nr:hypothetical protein CDD83_9439 [Cordyceps sp. RAO-2017]